MPVLTKPTEIAREALRLLASRRVEPTPDNYRQLYHEIAGHAPQPSTSVAGNAWGALIRELLREFDTRHAGITPARKKEGVEKVLTRAGRDPDKLFGRLQALVRSWAETPVADATPLAAEAEPGVAAGGGDAEAAPGALCEVLAQVLELGLAPQLTHAPALEAQAAALAQRARAAHEQAALRELAGAVRKFLLQIELSGAADAQVQQGLLRLLKLLIENIVALADDDQWLRGQVAAVLEIIAAPLDATAMSELESGLKQVIYKQGVLKNSLLEAKTAMKGLIARFVERLGSFSATAGDYHARIEVLSARIQQTDDVGQLNAILEEVVRETRQVQAATLRSREEIERARRQVEAAEAKIRQLEAELSQVSEKVREDQLTGTLNRRGLDEAYERVSALAERKDEPLCVALLDIDNFKQLNDSLGHQAGDDALVHLTQVIRDTIRPTDVIARYGGEEFVILLPDATLEAAVAIMTRVQRELTKRIFLHEHQRTLITFSAGVALRLPQEAREALFARTDKALYQAKRTGKNRVVAAS